MVVALGRLVSEATERLIAAGVPSARLDARLLAEFALRLGRGVVMLDPDRPIAPIEVRRFKRLINRRMRREPVSRITQQREFWSLPFRVDRATLDPRPDTEILVETILREIDRTNGRDAPLSLVDLGTGTGCILLSLLHELPNTGGLGIDQSKGAIACARTNAVALGLDGRADFHIGDWAVRINTRFDWVVSNPPYIPAAHIARLDPEVGFDPRSALDGGADGLDAYRRILSDLARILAPRGRGAFEIGHDQAESVAAIAVQHGFSIDAVVKDYAGNDRVVLLNAIETIK